MSPTFPFGITASDTKYLQLNQSGLEVWEAQGAPGFYLGAFGASPMYIRKIFRHLHDFEFL